MKMQTKVRKNLYPGVLGTILYFSVAASAFASEIFFSSHFIIGQGMNASGHSYVSLFEETELKKTIDDSYESKVRPVFSVTDFRGSQHALLFPDSSTTDPKLLLIESDRKLWMLSRGEQLLILSDVDAICERGPNEVLVARKDGELFLVNGFGTVTKLATNQWLVSSYYGHINRISMISENRVAVQTDMNRLIKIEIGKEMSHGVKFIDLMTMSSLRHKVFAGRNYELSKMIDHVADEGGVWIVADVFVKAPQGQTSDPTSLYRAAIYYRWSAGSVPQSFLLLNTMPGSPATLPPIRLVDIDPITNHLELIQGTSHKIVDLKGQAIDYNFALFSPSRYISDPRVTLTAYASVDVNALRAAHQWMPRFQKLVQNYKPGSDPRTTPELWGLYRRENEKMKLRGEAYFAESFKPTIEQFCVWIERTDVLRYYMSGFYQPDGTLDPNLENLLGKIGFRVKSRALFPLNSGVEARTAPLHELFLLMNKGLQAERCHSALIK